MKVKYILLLFLVSFTLFTGCKKSNTKPETSHWTYRGIAYKADNTYWHNTFASDHTYEFGAEKGSHGVYIDLDERPSSNMSFTIGDDVELYFGENDHFFDAVSGKVTFSVHNGRLRASFSNILVSVDGEEYKSSGVLIEQ